MSGTRCRGRLARGGGLARRLAWGTGALGPLDSLPCAGGGPLPGGWRPLRRRPRVQGRARRAPVQRRREGGTVETLYCRSMRRSAAVGVWFVAPGRLLPSPRAGVARVRHKEDACAGAPSPRSAGSGGDSMTDAAMQSSALRVASAAIHKEATWLLQRYHSLTAAEHALVREKNRCHL